MWNKEQPINMLNSVNQDYEIDSIKAIQKHIDIDKLVSSRNLDFDLCGFYAPFCDYCSRVGSYPCAYAFFKYKECTQSVETVSEVLEQAHACLNNIQQTTMDEITAEEPVIEEPVIEEEPEKEAAISSESEEDGNFEQLDFDKIYSNAEHVETIISDDPFVNESEVIEQAAEKKTFRLAVARRKNI